MMKIVIVNGYSESLVLMTFFKYICILLHKTHKTVSVYEADTIFWLVRQFVLS